MHLFRVSISLVCVQFRPLIEIRDTSPVTFDLNYESFLRSQIVTDCYVVLSYVKMSPGFVSFNTVVGAPERAKQFPHNEIRAKRNTTVRCVGYRHTRSTAITRRDEKFVLLAGRHKIR